jgi:hypothetical protein
MGRAFTDSAFTAFLNCQTLCFNVQRRSTRLFSAARARALNYRQRKKAPGSLGECLARCVRPYVLAERLVQ